MNNRQAFEFNFVLLSLLIGSAVNAAAPASFTDRTVAFVSLLVNQRDQTAFGQFDEQLKQALPPARLEAVWREMTDKLGAFRNTGETKAVATRGYTVVFVKSVFVRGAIWVQVAYDGDGKIGGLHFLPTTPS